MLNSIIWNKTLFIAKSAGAVRPPYECPGYDTIQSDGKVPVMLGLWGNGELPFIAIAPRSTLTRRGSTW